MRQIYNKSYFEREGYSKKKLWYPFFDQIAQKIVELYHPNTVLDAGCAHGYLVEALRSRNVQAYGIDVSEYAISYVDKSIKEFCKVQSIIEPLPNEFPKNFDLIVSIEVLEHLTQEEGELALKNLCSVTDMFLFSSTDTDIQEVSHINVQRKEYWAKIFAKNGFFRDVQQTLSFISPQADLYYKRQDVQNVIQEYEVALRVANSSNKKMYFSSYLYYDTGNGLNEKEKLTIENSICENKINFCIDIPKEAKSVRIDPIEEKFCIISQLKVQLDGSYCIANPVNGIVHEDMWIFLNTDPQINLELNGKNKLELSGNIIIMEDIGMTLMMEKLSVMETKIQEKFFENPLNIMLTLTELQQKIDKLQIKKRSGWEK